MKKTVLLKHLKENQCLHKREGSSHSWYRNIIYGNLAAVPWHADINEITVMKICKQLGIPIIK